MGGWVKLGPIYIIKNNEKQERLKNDEMLEISVFKSE